MMFTRFNSISTQARPTRWCVALLLLFIHTTASAEWLEVDRSDIQTTYADPASLDASGKRITIWLLSSYKTPRKYDNGKFQSVKSQYEYDCRGERFRLLAYSLHTGARGEGAELFSDASEDKWKAVVPGSSDEKLWKRVCVPEAGWSRVGESKAMAVYANPFSIRRKGDKVRLWQLFDLRTAKQHAAGQRYLSVKHEAEYDCKEIRYRTLSFSYYSANMGNGEEVFTDDDAKKWDAITVGSADHLFWKMACGSK